jgi:hypothetical protein
MIYKVESNIPIPKSHSNRRYPFAELKPGDSFVVPLELLHSARSAAYIWGARNGWKFTARACEDGIGRVWRIA